MDDAHQADKHDQNPRLSAGSASSAFHY